MGNAWIVAWTARASLPRKWPLGRRSGMPKRHTSTGRLRWPLLAGNYANFTHQSKIDGILVILLILFLLGGGYGYRSGNNILAGGGGLLGLILLILLILVLLRVVTF